MNQCLVISITLFAICDFPFVIFHFSFVILKSSLKAAHPPKLQMKNDKWKMEMNQCLVISITLFAICDFPFVIFHFSFVIFRSSLKATHPPK